MFPFSVYLDGAPEVNPACVRLILVCGPLRSCIPLVPHWLRPRFLYPLYCILIELVRYYIVTQQHSASASFSIAIYSCNLHGSDRVRGSKRPLRHNVTLPEFLRKVLHRSPRLVSYVRCTSMLPI